MPSLTDSAFIFVLALLLFGPKKLPVLARELGKWIGEFRRASNEFKMQMEEELRISEQADKQKKIADIQASAPAPPPLEPTAEDYSIAAAQEPTPQFPVHESMDVPEPSPIATSGELNIMPPSTGLPTPQTSAATDIAPLIDSIPAVDPPHHEAEKESAAHAG